MGSNMNHKAKVETAKLAIAVVSSDQSVTAEQRRASLIEIRDSIQPHLDYIRTSYALGD